MQGHPDESSVRNIFEGSFTEEGKVSGKSIFEWGVEFSAYWASKNFYSTASSDPGAIGEWLGSDFLVIREWANEQLLVRNNKSTNKWNRIIYY